MSNAPSARHQQEGMRLGEFATLHGLTSGQATRLARGGKILGAQRHSLSGHWFVYPPAKLMEEIRAYRKAQPATGFDFGTSPHGLPAGLPLPVQETPEALSLPPSAKPLLTSSEPSTGSAAEGAHQWRNKPNVYTSAKAACRCLRSAAAELASKPPYYLRLSDREFLQVYEAVNHDRSRTRKAIGKGLAEHGDLRASDPLWQILQDVMTRRMKGYRL